VKGVGHRLRINSSKTENFDESGEETARAFKISRYNYQETQKGLLEFRDDYRIELIKKSKTIRNRPEKGVRAFYVSKYDPRMPHPRQLISRNYHHLENHPTLAHLFPSKNLIGGTRRQKDMSELLSPTVQKYGGQDGAQYGDDSSDGDGGGGGGSGGCGGMVPTTVLCLKLKESAMCVAT
jgi:hypothetical protein